MLEDTSRAFPIASNTIRVLALAIENSERLGRFCYVFGKRGNMILEPQRFKTMKGHGPRPSDAENTAWWWGHHAVGGRSRPTRRLQPQPWLIPKHSCCSPVRSVNQIIKLNPLEERGFLFGARIRSLFRRVFTL
jgi:hypothetical protein